MDTKNNSGTDIDALTKFHPMPKRFMVWDKPNGQFLTISDAYPKCQISESEQKSVIFSLQDLIALFSEVLYYDNRADYIVCQSTNLFDEDGKEIFEGSIVRDFDDAIGVVYYDLEDGEYRAKSADGDNFELAESSCDLKVLGHILSNPGLLEDEDNHARDRTVEEGVIMSNFTARTRLRGEVTYHKANWIDNYYDHGAYGVKFLEGPHEGEIHPPKDCAIAKDDAYLLRRK